MGNLTNHLTKVLLGLVAVVGCSRCAPPKETPYVPLVFSQDYTLKASEGPWNGKRVILIHGFRLNRTNYEVMPFSDLVARLRLAGYEVITFDLPYGMPYHFIDGGVQYRRLFEEQLRGIVARVRADRGPDSSFLVGGFSWGGLHALMGQVLAPDLFSSYFAILPVTDMSAVSELSTVEAPHFNPLREDLSPYSGLISYGTRDERVNFRLTQELVRQTAPLRLTVIEYPGLGHQTTPQAVTDTLTWILTQ